MTTATSGVIARFPLLRVTGPLPSLVLRTEDVWPLFLSGQGMGLSKQKGTYVCTVLVHSFLVS